MPKLAAISEYGNPQEDQQWYFDVSQPVPPNISAEQLDQRAQELVDAGILGEECYEDTDSDQGDSEGEEALGAVAGRYLEAAAANPLDSEVECESHDSGMRDKEEDDDWPVRIVKKARSSISPIPRKEEEEHE